MTTHRHLLAACLALWAGCASEHNPYFCKGAPLDNCTLIDAGVDGPTHCTMDQQCTLPMATVCDLSGSMTCVQCTPSEPGSCVGKTPVCAADDACHACTAHAQCGSGACLPDGSCGDDTNVAYVNNPAGSDNNLCTKAMPCTKVAKALATNRPFVKFTGTTDEPVIVNAGRVVTFLSDPNAVLTRSSGGAILTVQDDNTSLTVHDLSINNGPNNANGFGLVLPTGSAPTVTLIHVTLDNDPGGGISVGGGSLTIAQSTITNNKGGGVAASAGSSLTIASSTISGNVPGGGVSAMNGTFVIVGNVFFNNGGNASSVGGISISTTPSAMNRLEFNSFAANTAQDGTGSGIHCLAGGAFTAKDNIVSDNRNLTLTTQVDGTCTHAYSIVHPGTPPSGITNFGDDPMFVNEAMGDLHLQTGSPARGRADPSADLTGIASHDIDGNLRVSPADIGAYEHHP